MTKSTRLIATWLACLAIMMAALAPFISFTISHILSNARGEVCTTAPALSSVDLFAQGGKFKKTSLPSPLEHCASFGKCPFCAHHVVSLEPVAQFALSVPTILGGLLLPKLFYLAPDTPFVWAPSLARAPPLFSFI